jgi:hypothetical protein
MLMFVDFLQTRKEGKGKGKIIEMKYTHIKLSKPFANKINNMIKVTHFVPLAPII